MSRSSSSMLISSPLVHCTYVNNHVDMLLYSTECNEMHISISTCSSRNLNFCILFLKVLQLLLVRRTVTVGLSWPLFPRFTSSAVH